ncbi:hypothetical protein GCM10008929_09340 [Alkalibacterium psychrotolerans]
MTFSRAGFFWGIFFYAIHILIYWMVQGTFFETTGGTLLFIYLSMCIWSYATIHSIIAQLETVLSFPYKGALKYSFIFSPFIYVWVKKEQ